MIFKSLKIAALFLCFFSLSTFALEPVQKKYDVEVIVFTHITKQALQTEQWPQLSSAEINSFDQTIAPMKTISTHLLTREDATLLHDPQYKVLLHVAWQPTWAGEGSSIAIPVHEGPLINGKTQLNGLITLRLSHYFDAHINLMLTKPTSELQKMAATSDFMQMKAPYFTFQLKQTQRMRSDELNYIGNPVMGMLIKIMPVQ